MSNSIATGVAYADPEFVSVQVGNSTTPVAVTSSGIINGAYATTSATSGDTRLTYQKLTFSSTGSGETMRGFSVVTGTSAATAGTINGAHFSCEMQGGSISGAANAVRATIGGTTAAPGGTLAALQLDTNFASGVTLPGSAAFMRVTNTNTVKISNFLNMPAPAVGGVLAAKIGSPTQTHSIKFVDDAGTTYYIMCTTTA
ncbi:hypothetical protein EBZ39_02040 [bacterium]|nr:hypothetical protein [bacterium]NDG03600.1 hypothetical protein [Synechococcaceae bacterium WBB_34_004]